MPVGNFTVYGPAKLSLVTGAIDLDTDNFSGFLATSSYTPTVNSDDTYSDVSANEVPNGSGYTTGGIDLGTLSVTRSGGTVTVDETTNPSWTSATFTCKYFVVARRAGGSLVAGDLLLGYCDLETGGGSISVSSGTLTININALGLFTLA
jgi:hypothetical protein